MSDFDLFTNFSTSTSTEITILHQNNASLKWLRDTWKVSTAVVSVSLFCSIWTCFSFFFYAREIYKSRRNKTSYHFAAMVLTILLPLMMSFHFLSKISLIAVGQLSPISAKGDKNCNIMMAVSSFTYVLASLPTYMLLWIRQKIMYSNPIFSEVNSKLIKVASFMSMFLLVFGGFGNWLIFLLTITYQKTELGCIKKEAHFASKIAYFSMLVSNIISHIFLFSLFCYPLRMHWHRTKKSTLNQSKSSSIKSTKTQIYELAKNALITLIGKLLLEIK